MKALTILFTFFIILSSTAANAQLIDKSQHEYHLKQSPHSLIESAFGESKISLDQKILYHAYALFDEKKLPAEYQSEEAEYCGTWVIKTIKINWNNLSEETKNILIRDYNFSTDGLLLRPTGLDSSRSTLHFKIHYSITPGDTNAIAATDLNGNGTPDYVDTLMYFAEEAYNYEINTMGYYPPPSDGNAGGDDKSDIYLLKIKTFGSSQAETLIGDNPNSPFTEVNAYTSYIRLRNNYQGQQWNEISFLKVTFAHEFYHNIQNGYDGWEASWICEATASWCEDEVYDDENINLCWLPEWFAASWVPLDANASECYNHWYGSWIFFKYLSETYSPALVRTIWEKSIIHVDSSGTDNSFKAIDDALTTAATNFKNVFEGFTAANYFPKFFYSEGNTYPQPEELGYAINNYDVTGHLKRKAAHYYVISPNLAPKGNDLINFNFAPLIPTVKFSIQVVTRKDSIITKQLFASNFSLSPTKDFDEIIGIVTNYDTGTAVYDYNLRIQTNSLIHRLGGDLFDAKLQTFSLSGNYAAWRTDGLSFFGRYYNGYQIFRLGVNNYMYGSYIFRPVVDSNTFAYQSLKTWTNVNPPRTTQVIQYFDGTTHTIGSSEWNVLPSEDNTTSDLLLHKGKIAFVAKHYVLTYDSRLVIADGSGNTQIISQYPSTYKQKLWQLNNGQVIWQHPDKTIYWYNGSSNVLPPTKHNNFYTQTVPKLYNGKMAWVESYKDTQHGASYNTWELFYFDGTNVNRITNDSVTDGFGDPTGISLDFKKDKIAWVRFKYSSLHGGELPYVHLYENGIIKTLWDSVTQGPQVRWVPYSQVRIDEKRGYVAWIGNYSNSPSQNIYMYDGKSIVTVIPANLKVLPRYFEIDDGKILFSAEKYEPYFHDLAVYLYEYDSTLTTAESYPIETPKDFSLMNNFPNPFNPTTNIRFSIPHQAKVKLKIYNILGEEIKTLIDEVMEPGTYDKTWNAANLASGVYIYQLKAGSFTSSKKMLLIK